MELNFNKKGNEYIAEFKVTGDFSLHVERDEAGRFDIYQRTTQDGEYASIENLKYQYGKKIIDYDFIGYVYPKNIKIISRFKPTYAAVVSDGEITELKFQDKSVEITANGTTSITPDNGFAALNSVKVKTNVPTSGEGGGASYRFYSIEKLESKIAAVEYVAPLFARVNGMIIPAAVAFASNMWESVSALSTDASAKLFVSGAWRNIGEILDGNSSFLQGKGVVEITEEEFYNLDNGGEE